MTHEAILPQHIDSTMLSCFRSCPRKFYLEFCYGLRPQGYSLDLHAGAAFATAIEQTYKEVWINHRTLDDALLRAHAAFCVAWGDFIIPEHKRTAKTFERMWEAVEFYFSKYPPHTDHIQPYFDVNGRPTFEYSFAIPLEPQDGFPLHPSGEPFLYSGRTDMLGKLRGRPIVRDEKTKGQSFGAEWAQMWNLRGQYIGYVWAMQRLGIPCNTVVTRGVSILKGKPTEEAPYDGLDTQEAEKIYSDFIVARWLDQLKRDLWRIRNSWDTAHFDYNFGETCTMYNKPCIFHHSCESNTPEMWFNDFETRRWNPLHKAKLEDAA